MKPFNITRRKRIFWAITAAVFIIAAAGLWYIEQAYSQGGHLLPPCLFHAFTGLYCTGCGMTRALHHLVNGRLYQAFRMNPLAVLSGPFLLWFTGLTIYRAVLRRPMPRMPSWAPWVIIAVIIVYTVARNLPWAPFAWLAPTEIP